MKDSPQGPIASLLAQEASLRARRRQQSATAAVRSQPPPAPKARIEPWSAGRRKSFGGPANNSKETNNTSKGGGTPLRRREATAKPPRPADFEDVSTSAASDGEMHSEKERKQANAVWDAFHQRNNAFVEEKETIISIMRQQKEAAEMEECTFQPTIPKTTEHVFAQPRPRGGLSLYERSMEDQLKKERRLHQMREHQLQEEMQECSFQPQRRRASCQQRGATPTRQVPSSPSSVSSRGRSSAGGYAQQFRPMPRPTRDPPARSNVGYVDCLEGHPFDAMAHEGARCPMPPFLLEDPSSRHQRRQQPVHHREDQDAPISNWQAPFGSQWAADDDAHFASHAQQQAPARSSASRASRPAASAPAPGIHYADQLASQGYCEDLSAAHHADLSGAAGAAAKAWRAMQESALADFEASISADCMR